MPNFSLIRLPAARQVDARRTISLVSHGDKPPLPWLPTRLGEIPETVGRVIRAHRAHMTHNHPCQKRDWSEPSQENQEFWCLVKSPIPHCPGYVPRPILEYLNYLYRDLLQREPHN